MKLCIALGLTSLLFGCSSKTEDHSKHAKQEDSHKHEDHQHQGHQHAATSGGELKITLPTIRPQAGQTVDMKLAIHNSDGSQVRAFDVVHEAKVHLAIISEDLKHFAHLHPEVDTNGDLSVKYTFPSDGPFRLFADFTPKDGKQGTVTTTMQAAGAPQSKVRPAPNVPGVIHADGTNAAISTDQLKSGASTRIRFALTDETGKQITLDPYMGELGHLMFIDTGTWSYVHVHPVGGIAQEGRVEFEAHFDTPGTYAGWGQFKTGGQVHVVPFVVNVE